jgi:hypothetical protein
MLLMRTTQFNTLSNPAAWQEALAQLPPEARDIYFTPEYHELHAANGDGTASCALVRDHEQMLLVPGLCVPIPPGLAGEADLNCFDLQTCNGYGGPLASPNASRDFLERAWPDWRQASRAQGMVAAFFRLHPLLDNARWLPEDAQTIAERSTVYVDLAEGAEASLRKAASKHRNMVNKGRREGVLVEWNDANGWDEFEELYAAAMERLDAPATLRFSSAYFARLRRLPGAELAFVRADGAIQAAAVFLSGPMWCHYHLSARREGTANHLMNCILHAVVERAAGRGLKGLHLGGGRSSAADDSLLRFKLATGGQLLAFKVALVIVNQERYRRLCAQWAEEAGAPPKWLLGYRQPKPSTAILA